MQQLHTNNSNLVEEVPKGEDASMLLHNISSFPTEPHSFTLGAANICKSSIDVPNVHDRNGSLITPDQYEKKLESGTIMMVNIYLKLWALCDVINDMY